MLHPLICRFYHLFIKLFVGEKKTTICKFNSNNKYVRHSISFVYITTVLYINSYTV